MTRDYLLVYTIKSTDALYSGGYLELNGIRVAELVTQRTNCAIELVGCIRAFKDDVVTVVNSSFGGTINVYAYK